MRTSGKVGNFEIEESTMDDHLLESPETLIQRYPLSQQAAEAIALRRHEILEILTGKDPRLLLIVGPCSIHNIAAGREYAQRLKRLSSEVEDSFLVIMRTYFEKPRTSFGWKGLFYDPHLDGSNDITSGIHLCRSFLLELAELGLAAATEFLEPLSSNYLADLISWGSIGARTVQSPIHREIASNLPMPVGFKNRNDGNIEIAVQAAASSKEGHAFLGVGTDGRIAIKRSSGNIFPHIVLRGSEEADNFDLASQRHAVTLLERYGLPPSLIIDLSHGNSRKNFRKQAANFSELIDQIQKGNKLIRGFMLESNLLESTQEALLDRQNLHLYPYPLCNSYSNEEIAFGASLTDPCLGWQATETLIKEAAKLNTFSLSLSLSLANL